MNYSWHKIKETLIKEIKPIFDDPNQPQYPFSFEDGIDLFCKTLLFHTGETELDGIAAKIIPTIDKYYHHKKDINDSFNYLTQIATKLDSFFQKLVFLFHQSDYVALKSANKGMFHFVKKSGINKGNIDFRLPISSVSGNQLNTNFGLHLYKSYSLRNVEAHTATDYRDGEIPELIKHSLVTYVFATFEYYNKLLAIAGGVTIPTIIEINEVVKELTPPLEYEIDLVNIIGRQEEIAHVLSLDNSEKILFLKGIGGIGKTTISKAYIKTNKGKFNHIVWLQAQQSLTQAVTTNVPLMDNLNIKFKSNVDEKIRFQTILNTLRKLPGRNLFVIDNFNDQNIEALLSLPIGPNWRVILTSRFSMKNSNLFEEYEIGVLSFDKAKLLFSKYYSGNIVDQELEALFNLIGYHTLSIELVAKTLETNFTIRDIANIISHLQNDTINNENWQVLIRTEQTDEELILKNHLLKTFDISALSEYEKQILLHFSILPTLMYDGIELIEIFDVEDKSNFISALNALNNKGWLIKSVNRFNIHSIIQEIVRIKIPPNFHNCKNVVSGINKLLDTSKKTSIQQKSRFSSLAEKVLSTIKSEEVEMYYLNVHTGIALKEVGNAQSGVPYLETALAIARKNSSSAMLVQVLSPLGIAYRLTGKLPKAVDAYKEAIKLIEKEEDKNYMMLQVYTNYGTLLEQLGTKESLFEAKNIYEFVIKELKLCTETFVGNQFLATFTANTKGSLGKIYSILGNHPKAIQLQKESYDELQKLGTDQFYISITANNLGLSYGYNKMPEESMKYHKIAVEIQEKILPKDHPDLSISKSGLANAFYLAGDVKKAKEIFLEVLKIGEATLPSNHPVMARRKSNLAAVCEIPNEIESAKSLYKEAIEIDTIHYTRDHPNIALNLFNLSMLFLKENNKKDAVLNLKEAFITFRKHYGLNHEFTKNTLYQLHLLGVNGNT